MSRACFCTLVRGFSPSPARWCHSSALSPAWCQAPPLEPAPVGSAGQRPNVTTHNAQMKTYWWVLSQHRSVPAHCTPRRLRAGPCRSACIWPSWPASPRALSRSDVLLPWRVCKAALQQHPKQTPKPSIRSVHTTAVRFYYQWNTFIYDAQSRLGFEEFTVKVFLWCGYSCRWTTEPGSH